jgi:hypothetical protein
MNFLLKVLTCFMRNLVTTMLHWLKAAPMRPPKTPMMEKIRRSSSPKRSLQISPAASSLSSCISS